MINKRYILVDGENTHPGEYKGIDKLTNKDTIIIFDSIFSKGHSNWELLYKIQRRPKKEQPTIIHSNVERKAKANEKDKMDYYMIANLTGHLTRDNSLFSKFKNLFNKSKTEYCIISKDKGFDRYINYFKDIYGQNVHRFNNFNDLNMYYKKITDKKINTLDKKTTDKKNNPLNKKNTSLIDISSNSSVDTNKLSQEVKTLTKLVKDLINKVEESNLNYSTSEVVTNDIPIKNTVTSLYSSNINNLTIDTLISKEKINGESTLALNEKNLNILDTDNSNVVYLCDFKNIETPNYSENIVTCSDIYKIEDNIGTSKSKKEFNKINLKKFSDNYSSYPKKKKLLRDGYFIKNIFIKHGLYDKYNNKSLDKFVKDCDNGLINIKTMTIRIVSSFSANSIHDFKPALNEIIKYQIKNDIM